MIDRINNGDKQALRELLTRYTKPIYERALYKLGDEKRAKDITRDTLADVVSAAEEGRCPQDVSAWILSMVDCRSSEQELDKILDEVLAEDPVGWNGGTSPSWTPDADAWSTAKPSGPAAAYQPVQPVYEQPVYAQPVQQPVSEPAAQQPVQPVYEQPVYEQPVYAQPAQQPVSEPPVRQPAYEPQERAHIAPPVREKPLPRQPKEEHGVEEPARTKRPRPAEAQGRDVALQPKQRTAPDLFDDDEDEFDEPKRKKNKGGSGVGMVLLILLLLLLVGVLVWMLVVMLMTRGVLPRADLGFADWFNANIFKLY